MSDAPKLSRRQFVIGTVGVSVIGLGGLGFWSVQQPALEFIERSYGEQVAGEVVLVAYASTYGSTGGVADAIAQSLYAAGIPAEVRRVENVVDITRYRAAIIGSPIISNEWMPAAVSFVEQQRRGLASMPVVYFLTSMALALSQNPNEREIQVEVLHRVEQRVPEVQPIELGLFAGAVDYAKMSQINQLLYRYFSEDDSDGDYRDFNAIKAWTDALRPRLLA